MSNEMTGRQRVRSAIACEPTDRIAWVPFVGCHAGSLLGVSAREFLRDEEKIVVGVQKAIDLYSPTSRPSLPSAGASRPTSSAPPSLARSGWMNRAIIDGVSAFVRLLSVLALPIHGPCCPGRIE